MTSNTGCTGFRCNLLATSYCGGKGLIASLTFSSVIGDIVRSVCYIEVTGNLEIDHTMRNYCTLPYPGHPEGCPNFGKRKECPPSAPLVEDFVDLSRPHYFMVAECDFNTGTEKKAEEPKNAKWYWDECVEPVLRERVKEFQKEHPGAIFTLHPSAVGVDVFKTAQNVGISLESTPEKTFCRVALIGYPI